MDERPEVGREGVTIVGAVVVLVLQRGRHLALHRHQLLVGLQLLRWRVSLSHLRSNYPKVHTLILLKICFSSLRLCISCCNLLVVICTVLWVEQGGVHG